MVTLRLAPVSHGITASVVHCNYALFELYHSPLCSELVILELIAKLAAAAIIVCNVLDILKILQIWKIM